MYVHIKHIIFTQDTHLLDLRYISPCQEECKMHITNEKMEENLIFYMMHKIKLHWDQIQLQRT